jgi:hypothetical protein
MLVGQHQARLKEACQLGDDISKVLSVAACSGYISKVRPAAVRKMKAKMKAPGSPDYPVVWQGHDVEARGSKAIKIGAMAFDINVFVPLILDKNDVKGNEKAQWIEWLAKAQRYGMGFFARNLHPGSLEDDLVFEALFTACRVTLILTYLDLYIDFTQKGLDDDADLLRLGVYGGDTFAALSLLNAHDKRIENRTRGFHLAFGGSMGSAGVVRGLDGIFKVTAPMFQPDALQPGKDTLNAFQKGASKTAGFIGKWGGPLVWGTYGLLFEGFVLEMVIRLTDMTKLGHVALFAEDLKSASSADDPDRRRDRHRRPRTRAAKAPSAALAAYLGVLDRVATAVKRRDRDAYGALRDELVAAHDALFDPWEALYARCNVGSRTATGAGAATMGEFLGSISAAADAIGSFYCYLEPWTAAAQDAATGEALLSVLAAARKRVVEADAAASAAAAAAGGATLPCNLDIAMLADPDAATVMSGAPFALTFRVTNRGDANAAAGTVELLPGEGLALGSAAKVALPALAAGARADLTWTLTATARNPVGFSASVFLSGTTTDGQTTGHEETIMVFGD